MTISRRRSPPPARPYARRLWPNNGRLTFQALSAAICLVAIFFSSGGHWAVLQSVAYARMVVEFAQKDSLGIAVKKAFAGRHFCSLCPKIRDGYNEQRKAPRTQTVDRLPEFVGQSGGLLLFMLTQGLEILSLLPSYIDFSTAPPKPPPRLT